ncbi:MAG: hypothetical protein ACREMF_10610, partial [Gemmatimonadales bacterium]
PQWWTVALVNWDDEPRSVSVPLEALGVGAAGCHAYDVWADAPLPDVRGTLTTQLEPHTVLVAALRPLAARPQVIGTTRHVVQGVVDLEDEAWNPATRTLVARSVRLDRRRYAVTIAVPRGMRPGVCKSDVPCTARRLPGGNTVIEWAAPEGKDIAWELRFVGTPRP